MPGRSGQVNVKELKINLLSNFKHHVKRSHSWVCSLKKMHTTLHLFCFHMSNFIFFNKNGGLEKKFEHFFIGSEQF